MSCNRMNLVLRWSHHFPLACLWPLDIDTVRGKGRKSPIVDKHVMGTVMRYERTRELLYYLGEPDTISVVIGVIGTSSGSNSLKTTSPPQGHPTPRMLGTGVPGQSFAEYYKKCRTLSLQFKRPTSLIRGNRKIGLEVYIYKYAILPRIIILVGQEFRESVPCILLF